MLVFNMLGLVSLSGIFSSVSFLAVCLCLSTSVNFDTEERKQLYYSMLQLTLS